MDGSPFLSAGTPSPADLSSKYTKLAAEYSKVRAQLGVLKKALVEEQVKLSETSETMKQKEQCLRKYEAEMDSLTFRNQQLARRVEVLQDELETARRDRKAKRDHLRDADRVAASETLNSVMSEELQLKIAENARLHAALSEVDKQYEDKIAELQSQIRHLDSVVYKMKQSARAEDTKQKELIHGLKQDKVELLSKVGRLQQDLADTRDKATLLQVQLESAGVAQEANSPSLSSSSSSFVMLKSKHPAAAAPSQRPADDHVELVNSTEARIRTLELLSQFGENVQEVVAALSDMHTYWEHRLKDVSSGQSQCISATCQAQLSQLLLHNVKYLKPIETAYQQVLSGMLSASAVSNGAQPEAAINAKLHKQFQPFCASVTAYVQYCVRDLEPLMVDWLQQESAQPSCTSMQKAFNRQLQSSIRELDRILVRVSEHLVLLVACDKEQDTVDLVEDVTVAVSQLHQQATDLLSVYADKAANEQELPTVSLALRNTNQCIVASLSHLVTSLSSLSHTLSDNLPQIAYLITTTFPPGPEPQVAQPHPGDKVETLCRKEDQEHQAILDQLKQQVDQLRLQLDSANEKFLKSEQAKEHWKLESQLLKMKHDKLKLKSPSDVGATGATSDTGSLADGNEDDPKEEQDVKRLVSSTVDSLVSDRLLADSKAVFFYLECLALKKRMLHRDQLRLKTEQELVAVQDNFQDLKEEIGVTTSNYEEQLKMMTEHVASMNEKLAAQSDQIERLKYELQQSGGKKK